VYSELAARFGVEISASALNQAFLQTFRETEPLAFPGINPAEIPTQEFEWWQAIALQTFQRAGVLNQFNDFSKFFTELYKHFATALPWFVYPDVRPTLEYWREHKIEIGILSNFDSRLYSVLQSLDLTNFFTSVTISSEIGAAKPSLQIFTAGLQKHNCLPEAAWHIGDSFKEDYQGACAAGIKAIWLQRDQSVPVRRPAAHQTEFQQQPDILASDSLWVDLHA
jgi:putative hydrolase of the HAD superfamily